MTHRPVIELNEFMIYASIVQLSVADARLAEYNSLHQTWRPDALYADVHAFK
jgi:hypothetical protein